MITLRRSNNKGKGVPVMGTTKVLLCNEEFESHKKEIIKGTKFTFDKSNERALSMYVKIFNIALNFVLKSMVRNR